MSLNINQKFLSFLKRIWKKSRPSFSFHYVAYTILFVIVTFSVINIVTATTPNPGHPWIELGDGVFTFTSGQTVTNYTYTFPAASTTVLTTNAVVTVAQGGIGVGTLASNGVLYGNATGAVQALAVNAGATQCLTQASSAAPAWGACGTSTLQGAYDASSGNTILTTTARNLALTLGEVATPTSFTIENQDTAGVSAQRIFNSIASGTLTNGLLIENTNAGGTITNAIQIAETAGTITDGILITGTLGNILNSGSIDITGAGAITGATGVTTTTLTSTTTVDLSSDSDADTITIGQSGTTDDTVTIAGNISLTDDQWSVSATGVGAFITGTTIGSQTFTTNNILDSGALTIKTTTSSALTLDSGTTGTVNLGNGNNAKTINIGTGTAGNAINLGTDNTTQDTITLGSALDLVNIDATTFDIDATTLDFTLSAGTTDFTINGLDADSNIILSGGTFTTCTALETVANVLTCGTDDGGGGARLDQITAATADDTDNDNTDKQISWAWSTASTQNPFTMTANALTTGTLLNLTSTSTALTSGGLLNISATGAPAASWTGDLAKIEYNNADTDVDGSALKVGLLGAGAGDGTALNITTAQTGTSAFALRINDDGTYTDSSPLVVTVSGTVGIGTTAPVNLLDVVNGAQNTGTGGAGANAGAFGMTSADIGLTSNGAQVFLASNSAWGIDKGGSIGFGGLYGAGTPTNDTTFAKIKGAKETSGAGNTGGYLAFATYNHNAGLLAERMRIDSSGNLGINTAGATARLHVVGADGATGANAQTALTVLGGTGATASSGTAYTGGPLTLTGGTGGTATSTANGGAGGALTFTGGAGGVATAGNAGGVGGAITIVAGTGGDGNLAEGGNGGNISVTAGNAGGGGGGQGLSGGNVIIDGGTGLTTGNVLLATVRGSVGINDVSPDGLFDIDSSATSGIDFGITNTGVYTGTGLFSVVANSATTGTVGTITSSTLNSGKLLSLTAGGATALTSGNALLVTGPTGAAALSGAAGGVVNLTAAGAYTSSNNAGLLNLNSGTATGPTQVITANAITTGTALLIPHTTSVIANGGSLLRLSSTSVDTSTTTGTLLDLSSTSAATGTLALITDTGLTTGRGLNINHTTSVIADGGTLFRVGSTSADTATNTGALAYFTSTGSTTSNQFVQSYSGLTTGTGQVINGSSAYTTGGSLSVTAGYTHTAAETGSAMTIGATDYTSAGFATTTNSLLISPTFAMTGSSARTLNGISIAPTISSCGTTGGSCTLNNYLSTTPARTQSTTNTFNMNGFNIASAGALVQDTAAGTINWIGANIQMPNITQTTGTVTSTGIKITGGTVTSGTAYALTTDANAGNVGIGDTSPTEGRLTLVDTSNTVPTLYLANNTATTLGVGAIGGVNVVASTTLTTGDLLELQLTEGTLTTGNYLSAWDVTAGASVFEIGEDGIITLGTSNTVLTLATGMIDADALTLTAAADGGTGTNSGSGLIARSDGIGLLQGCADAEILAWDEPNDYWECATAGGGASWNAITSPVGNQTLTFDDTEITTWNAASDTEAIFTLNANSLTTGEAMTIAHTTSVIADGGSLLRLSSTSADTGGATNGTLLDLAGNSTATGTLARISGTGLTTGKGLVIVGGTAMTTGSDLEVNGATYVHGTETGSLAKFTFTDATIAAVTSTTNGLLVSPTINVTTGASGTKTINGLSIEPTFTACTGGSTCNPNALNIANVTDGTGFTSSGLKVGTGWDYDIQLMDTTPTIRLGATDNTAILSITDSNASPNSIMTIGETSNGFLDFARVSIGTTQQRDQLFVSGRINSSWDVFWQDFLTPFSLAPATELTADTHLAYYGGLILDEDTDCDMAWGALAGASSITIKPGDGGAAAGEGCALTSLATNFSKTENPVFETRVRTAGTAGQHIWVGFTTQAIGQDTATEPTEGIYFRKMSTDTNWQCVNNAASSSVVDSGTAPSSSAFQTMRIEVENTADDQTRFFINGTQVCSSPITTNVPTNSLGFTVTSGTSDNVIDNLHIDYIRVWNDMPPEVAGGRMELEGLSFVRPEEAPVTNLALNETTGRVYDDEMLRAFFAASSEIASALTLPQVYAGRLTAGLEVISPRVIAQSIETDTISSSLGENISLILTPDGKFTIGGQTTTTTTNEDGTETSTTTKNPPVITFDSFGNAVFAGSISAKEIKVGNIEGLEAITDQINTLAEGQEAFILTAEGMKALGVALSIAQADIKKLQEDLIATNETIAGLVLSRTDVETQLKVIEKFLTKDENGEVNGITTNILTVTGDGKFGGKTEFSGLTFFSQTTSFTGGVIFTNQAEFALPPLYNKDSAGYALIKRGDRRAKIEFENPYIATPVVNTSVTFEEEDNVNDEEAENIFSDNIRFLVVGKNQEGFTILLNKPAPRDMRFSWNALSVKDPKIFESIFEGLVIESPVVNTETPNPTPESEMTTTEGNTTDNEELPSPPLSDPVTEPNPTPEAPITPLSEPVEEPTDTA